MVEVRSREVKSALDDAPPAEPGVRGRWRIRADAWALKLDRAGAEAPPLCDQIRDGIRAKILNGQLFPGDALMPQRRLCKLLDVNQVTLTKAISDLLREGLLRSEHGRGLFVNAIRPRRVAVVVPKGRERLKDARWTYREMLEEVDALLTRNNVRLEWFTREQQSGSRFGPTLAPVVAADVDAYLTVGIQNEEYLAALTGTGRPVVALDAAPTVNDFDGVVADSFREGYLAARHLLELGHRKILFLGHDRGLHPGDPARRARIPEPDCLKRLSGVRYALEQAGVAVAPDDLLSCLPEPTAPEGRALAARVASGAWTACITIGVRPDWLFEKARVPQEMSAVEIGTLIGHEAATRCGTDFAALGRAGARRMLERLVQGAGASSVPTEHLSTLVTMAPALRVGKSTRRIGPPPELYEYLKHGDKLPDYR